MFSQQYWKSIKNDFVATTLAFLNQWIWDSRLNETIFFPKVTGDVSMQEFKLKLNNVFSRVVSKVIANRLQGTLSVIPPKQSAFIKGRSITDSFIIAHYIKKGKLQTVGIIWYFAENHHYNDKFQKTVIISIFITKSHQLSESDNIIKISIYVFQKWKNGFKINK